MAQDEKKTEPTAVERWLKDQQEWQRVALAYLDSMVHNEDFLVHLGNAMRGSLLAGKPYPTKPPDSAAEPQSELEARVDEILHTLHEMQGELRDLRMAIEVLAAGRDTGPQREPASARRRSRARTSGGAKSGSDNPAGEGGSKAQPVADESAESGGSDAAGPKPASAGARD